MYRFPIFFSLLLMGALALAIGCSGSSDENPGGPLVLSVSTGFGGVLNQGEALTFSASGLNINEFPVLVEAIAEGGSVVSMARLTADNQGRIDDVIIAYDVGFFPDTGDGRLSAGEYTIRLTSLKGTVERTVAIPTAPTDPIVWGCDIDGNLTNAVLVGEPVFVAARALKSGANYRIWPVIDKRAWNDGDIISSWSDDRPLVVWPPGIQEYIEVTSNAGGEIEPIQLLPYATKILPGVTDQFDIVLDAEPFGVFNSVTDAVDGQLPTGIVVQDVHTGGPIYAQLASHRDYTYSNNFKVGDSIYIWLNPSVILDQNSLYVLKYILLHSDIWEDGMTIEDITGGVELDPVQEGCVNEGIILAWILAQEGVYDILLDINGNGIYDEGVDVLDGGPGGPGFIVTE
ncbi:hypothetical protein KAU08_11560 [bacterium]|nr:hypothetical protein [bacterium]